MKHKQHLLLLSSLLFFCAGQAQAGVFKCTNAQGAIYYNDKPCSKKDKESQLKIAKSPKNTKTVDPYLLAQQEEDEFAYNEIRRKHAREEPPAGSRRLKTKKSQPKVSKETDSKTDKKKAK